MSEEVIPPAGVSPASAFEAPTFAAPARAHGMLADDIDVATGNYRSINSRVHPVDAAIREQLRLRRETGAAVREHGNRFTSIEKVNDSTPRQIEDETRRLLRPFVERGDIRINKLVTESPIAGSSNDTGLVTVHYDNLRSQRTGQKVSG